MIFSSQAANTGNGAFVPVLTGDERHEDMTVRLAIVCANSKAILIDSYKKNG